MDPMDQFFKKKLKERQYEYRESYWKEAERMIRLREGRRRVFWWWFLVVGLLLITIGGWGWWYFQPGKVETVENGVGARYDDGSQEGVAGVEGESLSVGPPVAQDRQDGRQAAGPDSKTRSEVDGRSLQPAGKPAPGLAEEAPGPSEAAASAAVVHSAKNITSGEMREEKGLNTRRGEQKGLAIDASESARLDYEETEPIAGWSNEKMQVEQAYILRGPAITQASTPETDVKLRKPAIRPRKMLNWEMALAATVNPSGGKTLLGGSAGLRASAWLKQNMLLSLGVQYRLRGGTFGPSQESEVVTYRFGRQEQNYRLEPSRLHYAEALLQAEWPVRRHSFAIGLGWIYLLGIEGSLSRSVKEEFALNIGAASSQEKGWLDEGGYKKSFWSARIGYHYRLSGRLKTGLEIQYSPGGILQESTGGEFAAPLLEESGPLLFDMGIKYSL